MTNINKIITLVLLIIIVFAIIIFCVTNSKHSEPILESDPINSNDSDVIPLFIDEYTSTCGILSNLLAHDQCTLNLSEEEQSTELCHFIANETYKNECYNINN